MQQDLLLGLVYLCTAAVSVQVKFVTNLWGGRLACFTRTSTSHTLQEASLVGCPFRLQGTTLASAGKGRKSKRCPQVLGAVKAAGARRGREERRGGAQGKTETTGWNPGIRARHDQVQREAEETWGPKDRGHPNAASQRGSHE